MRPVFKPWSAGLDGLKERVQVRIGEAMLIRKKNTHMLMTILGSNFSASLDNCNSHTTNNITASSDHLSPKYLRENYAVREVTLQSTWDRGRVACKAEWPDAVSIFAKAVQAPSTDMLSPHGMLLVDIRPLAPIQSPKTPLKLRITLRTK